jgi:peroxiredoxin (alkyl hydroperoxide reductase subunit C)
MENCCEIARIGKEAPLFTVQGFDAVNECFETYSLQDYRGKYVLLFFYPGDFTYVCPTELVSIASLKEKFAAAETQVFVISTDSRFSHKEWNESELSAAVGSSYPYPMLSDSLGKIGRPYGIFDEEDGVDLRGVVLIDKKGVVQLISVNAPPLGRNPKEILRANLALKQHDDGGKVIPACWNPGDDVIDPTYENSGNMWSNYKNVIQRSAIKE